MGRPPIHGASYDPPIHGASSDLRLDAKVGPCQIEFH